MVFAVGYMPFNPWQHGMLQTATFTQPCNGSFRQCSQHK